MNDLINHIQSEDSHPNFELYTPQNVEQAVDYFIAADKSLLNLIIDQVKNKTIDAYQAFWQLSNQKDCFGNLWNVASHIKAVGGSKEFREMYNRCSAKISEYYSDVGQNPDLYNIYLSIKNDARWSEQAPEFQRSIELTLRGFEHSGIGLHKDQQNILKQLSTNLVTLSNKFTENISDCRDSFYLHVHTVDDLDGVPENTINIARAEATKRGLDGYGLTLDYSVYSDIMSFCSNRNLRYEMYRSFTTVGSLEFDRDCQFDNTFVMSDIVNVKHTIANVLGFDTYADLSLSKKMAKTPSQVFTFLEDIFSKIKYSAVLDKNDIVQYGNKIGIPDVQPWDVSFINNKIMKERYSLDSEEIKKYFTVERVKKGLFNIVNKMFGITIIENNNVRTYQENVHYYDVVENGQVIAGFYLDLFEREGKSNGAWMSECRELYVNSDDGVINQIPIAFLTCNFSAPSEGIVPLLTHDDVVTLFHEFGHGLHHMLTKQTLSNISGISGVEWDAVELPSQFMENWCWEREIIKDLSEHHQTKDQLPDEMIDALISVKNFRSAYQLTRQIAMSTYDLKLYSDPTHTANIHSLVEEINNKYLPMKQPDFIRTENSFNHIFGGGYSAGYYSYMWAEVLSCDAFGRFQEEGLYNPKVSKDFREQILEKGGANSMKVLFENFRGRAPTVDKFLEISGI